MMTTGGWRKPTRRNPAPRRDEVIDFHNSHGIYSGTDSFNRRWRITQVSTGWQLEFQDPGDMGATYAGTHRTLAAAEAEAARQVRGP